ncbi:MAG TPA: MerR family transcriptional regulator [Acidimicrobiales bacterium]|nr:MerR family transcriptional regulator [Acidimicrobiales bacterium]
MLSIGELAARSGVAVSAIRYYEELGLLPPAERVSGRRQFDEAAVERLRAIGAAQEAGFQLAEIAMLFDGARRHDLVQEKLAEVRARIRRLEKVAAALERAAQCGCSSLDHCPIVLRRPVRRGS